MDGTKNHCFNEWKTETTCSLHNDTDAVSANPTET